MLEKLKAKILFERLLRRPDIEKAYAMVKPSDSWFETITKVHNSLHEIQQLPHEILSIQSHDGLNLKAVYYPCQEEGKVTVICVHGYSSHAEREWAFPGLFYHSMGFNVLIPYQRAHGLSEGKYISFGALEHLDVTQWIDEINKMRPDGSIILHGLSMGGGIVLDLADKEMQNVKCLIADAPNISIQSFFKDVAAHVFKNHHDKIFEHISTMFTTEFGAHVSEFDAVETVKAGKYPLLLSAGSNENLEDTFAKLTENYPCDTETIILPGCNHGNGMYKQTQLYQGKIRDFIGKYITDFV